VGDGLVLGSIDNWREEKGDTGERGAGREREKERERERDVKVFMMYTQ
jgi:hypothetical protein